jgi:hypothetical protein
MQPPSGFVQVIKGEGMPSFGRKGVNGDLFVEYNVVLPVDISPELRRSKSPSVSYWRCQLLPECAFTSLPNRGCMLPGIIC